MFYEEYGSQLNIFSHHRVGISNSVYYIHGVCAGSVIYVAIV